MAELVNVVGGGNFPVDLDLEHLYNELSIFSPEYFPESHSGLKLKLNNVGVTAMLFQPGSYHLTGGKSIDEISTAHEELVSIIVDIVDFQLDQVSDPEIRNLVYVDDLHRELDLVEIDDDPAIKKTEYKPREFPNLIYRPENEPGVFTISRTGKVVLTGVNDPSVVEGLYDDLSDTLSEDTE